MADTNEPGPAATGGDARYWRERLAPYAVPRLSRSCVDLVTSLLAYVAVSAAMVVVSGVSGWLAVALAPVSAACLLRTFIVFHDCAHGSFLPWPRANRWLGAALGVVVLSPFARWRCDHAVHHASSGDLDRRGVGDLPTLTVAEYHARSPRERLAYRLFRSPLVMFGVGPIVAMIIGPRLVGRGAPARMRNSVLLNDAVIAVLAGLLAWWLGPLRLLLVWGPAAMISGAVGIWLFYVQHQFEDVYWERGEQWDYSDAALRGSSFLALPRVLQFCTGNIGFHHIHHLAVRIPNYNLERAHAAHPAFAEVPVLTLADGMRATRLKLWDEERGRLVTFAQAAIRPRGTGLAARASAA